MKPESLSNEKIDLLTNKLVKIMEGMEASKLNSGIDLEDLRLTRTQLATMRNTVAGNGLYTTSDTLIRMLNHIQSLFNKLGNVGNSIKERDELQELNSELQAELTWAKNNVKIEYESLTYVNLIGEKEIVKYATDILQKNDELSQLVTEINDENR